MKSPVSAWKAGTRWPLLLSGVLLVIAIGVGVGEATGWPWLLTPVQSWLSKTLDRRIDFGPEAGNDGGRTRVGLIGSGAFIGQGLVNARIGDRSVTVRGLAERDPELADAYGF